MSREDIIRMAREATDHLPDADSIRLQGIVLLALDAGEQAEREECAKLAESTICDTHLLTGVRIYGTRAASAIRARENT